MSILVENFIEVALARERERERDCNSLANLNCSISFKKHIISLIWKIGFPESRVLYTVLQSPHIDQKSRENFELEIKKKMLVIKTETHELRLQ